MTVHALTPSGCFIAANLAITLFNIVGMALGCKPPSVPIWLLIWLLLFIAFLTAAGYRV